MYPHTFEWYEVLLDYTLKFYSFFSFHNDGNSIKNNNYILIRETIFKFKSFAHMYIVQ